MQKKLRKFALLLVIISASQTLSCSMQTKDHGISELENETTAEASEDYVYMDKWSGRNLTILNPYDIYSMHSELDRECQTGEPLDDAMYNRCRKLEEKMDITLVENNAYMISSEVNNFAMKTIMADSDEFDIMYISTNGIYALSKANALCDLYSLDYLNLDREWWQIDYNKLCEMNGALYSAVGSSHLMYIDSLWCIYFNQDKLDDLKLDSPYDLVRNGKWTLDIMLEYQKAAADLAGDKSFDFDANGKCIYGLSGGMVIKFLAGCGEKLLDKNNNGEVIFTAGSERFYTACEKIAEIVSKDGGVRYTNYTGGLEDGAPGNYVTMFEIERSLFLHAEVCKTQRMRMKDFMYGIVPNPKLDESQDHYYASPFNGSPALTIPVTANDKEFSAAAADALSYISYNEVLPIYKEITLETKGLRNDDSIEMLGIILDGCCPDLTYLYSDIVNEFSNSLQNAINNSTGNYASIVASHLSTINKRLEEVNEVPHN